MQEMVSVVGGWGLSSIYWRFKSKKTGPLCLVSSPAGAGEDATGF